MVQVPSPQPTKKPRNPVIIGVSRFFISLFQKSIWGKIRLISPSFFQLGGSEVAQNFFENTTEKTTF